MTPKIAAIFCFIFIIAVIFKDIRLRASISISIWIPFVWFAIMVSRPIGLWIYPESGYDLITESGEGSLVDRISLSIFMILGIFVLLKRPISWGRLIRENIYICLFFLYCGISVLWSDFFDIALKRWVRAIGCLIMILIIATEDEPMEALKAVITRVAYLLIPLSILLIKYYRELGITYNQWTGQEMVIGVTTDKNALGRLCMITGVFFLWNLLAKNQEDTNTKKDFSKIINIVFLGLSLWLLIKSNSATSLASFFAGAIVLLGLSIPSIYHKKEKVLRSIIVLSVLVILFELLFNVRDSIILLLGRDPTLTERTDIWKELWNVNTNPIIGTGYDSFWIGKTLEYFVYNYHVNEAHNGYLGLYLELGSIGIIFFFAIIITAFRKINKSLIKNFNFGKLQVAFLIIFLLYNITEEASKITTSIFFTFILLNVDAEPYWYYCHNSRCRSSRPR
jgi:exopolysaccharide production protein ExoQ